MSQGNILYRIDNGEQLIDREADVEVGDYIYINSDGKAEKALSASINTMPCIGRVTRLVGDKCAIRKDFIETEYADINPRDKFFISNVFAGELMDAPPTDPQSVIQDVGFGINEDRILVNIDPSNVIIRS